MFSAHKNVKIFISQCGLQSTQEAIHFGINIICTPLFRDQIQISRKVVSYGIGMELDIFHLSSQIIYETLQEIISNPWYVYIYLLTYVTVLFINKYSIL